MRHNNWVTALFTCSALTDPQSITVNAQAKSMPRILSGGTSASYEMSDRTFALQIKHNAFKADKKNRIRSTATFTQRAVVADPLTAVNDFEVVSVSVQIDRPEAGFTSAQVDQMVTGFKAWLDSTMVGKLYGRES